MIYCKHDRQIFAKYSLLFGRYYEMVCKKCGKITRVWDE